MALSHRELLRVITAMMIANSPSALLRGLPRGTARVWPRFSLPQTLSLLLLLVPGTASCSPTSRIDDSTSCPFRVVREGPARNGDVPFIERDSLLRDPERNTVPGPRGLRAVVHSDAAHHPSIFLEADRRPPRLLRARASRPRWSPRGRYIACMVGHSLQRPWELSVVDVASGRHWDPEAPCHAMNYAWSPKGDAIAFEGPGHAGQHRLLCVVTWPGLRLTVLDSLPVSTNFHFSWSPDSRWLVTDRATRLDSEEDVNASDLWLVSRDGRRCQLTNTPDLVETEPHWVNDRRIQFLRAHPTDDGADEESRSLDLLPVVHRPSRIGGPL